MASRPVLFERLSRRLFPALWVLFVLPMVALPPVARALPAQQALIVGTQRDSRLGETFLSIPDLDGDGSPELLVSAPNVSTLFLVFNLPTLSGVKIPETTLHLIQFQEPGPIIPQVTDLDQDGNLDLVVGRPDRNGRGEVLLFRGPLDTSSPLTEAQASLTLTGVDGSALGTALLPMPASANLSARLYVGAPGYAQDAGGVYELSFDALNAQAAGDTVAVDAVTTRLITIASPAARFGSTLAEVPDAELDGDAEVAIGAPAAAPGGEVYFLTSTVSPDLTELTGGPRIETTSPDLLLGSTLAAQLDTSGTVELWLGAPGNPALGTAAPVGRVALLPVEDVLTLAQTDGSAYVLEDAPWSLLAEQPGSGLGKAIAFVPDLNGDNLAELLLGAPDIHDGAGEVYFALSQPSKRPMSLADMDFTFKGDGNSLEKLGSSLAGLPAPDQGLVLLGAPRATDPDSGTRNGGVYLLDLLTFVSDQDQDGQSPLDGDCDDHDPTRTLSLPETCDGIDNNCDGQLSTLEQDADGDGYAGCTIGNKTADCDVDNPSIHPGAPEQCDGLDNDCDGQVPANESDEDHDGARQCASRTQTADCDDADPNTYPGASELCDGLDNACSGAVPTQELDHDNDGVPGCATADTAADCDDLDPRRAPTLAEQCDGIDNNCDQVLLPDELDADDDGYSTCPSQLDESFPNGDCDDQDASRHPHALELCDGNDSDCDGQSDQDTDGDGYFACADGADGTLQDCNDTDPSIHPGATEACDGKDNDCDGQVPPIELDADHDGYRGCAGDKPADCNDASAAQAPGLPELCDGKDNDCDGEVPPLEQDKDGDGYRSCQGEKSVDCDDKQSTVYPGAPELCDGLDSNCDGGLPLIELDQDADSFSACEGDCNDAEATINPKQAELCDGLDNNCDGLVPVSETTDGDLDGFTVCAGDCNDSDTSIYPGAPELADKKDNDCNGLVDDVPCIDGDGDGFPLKQCTGSTVLDCDDSSAAIYPNAPEGTPDETAGWLTGDGLDNDCDGNVDEGTDRYDDDNDGFTELKGDCDDYNPAINPGALERLDDGKDNDCNGQVDEDDPRLDNDGDGYANQSGSGSAIDCDDSDPLIHPGQSEDPDTAYDDNCDGVLTSDRDGDGISDAEDCQPDDAASFPGAIERADGLDNNCDGAIDEGLSDGPGWSCGALAQSGGVAIACSTVPLSGGNVPVAPRPAPLPWLLLLGVGVACRRRRT